MKRIKKKWGNETWIVNGLEYCGKILTVEPNHQCSLHFHKNKKETFYILCGTLKLSIFNFKTGKLKHRILNTGKSITLLPMTPHSFQTVGEESCTFIEFSTHHEDSDSYRITRSK